jgi:nitrite reductase/ring-hydroxylating ferredoxin subunit
VFVLPADGPRQTGLLIESPTAVRVYRNRCPHWSVPLDSNSSHIEDGDALACSIHGARFDPLSGACTDGPCEGSSLIELPSELDGEFVVVLRPLLTT